MSVNQRSNPTGNILSPVDAHHDEHGLDLVYDQTGAAYLRWGDAKYALATDPRGTRRTAAGDFAGPIRYKRLSHDEVAKTGRGNVVIISGGRVAVMHPRPAGFTPGGVS